MSTTSIDLGKRPRSLRNTSRSQRFTRERTTELPTLLLTVTPRRRHPRLFGAIIITMDPAAYRSPRSCTPTISRRFRSRWLAGSDSPGGSALGPSGLRALSGARVTSRYFFGAETTRRLRPLARRRFSTLRPATVELRFRNPWVRFRFTLLG